MKAKVKCLKGEKNSKTVCLYLCPNCNILFRTISNNIIIFDEKEQSIKRCRNCGQEIDWGDLDERICNLRN